MFSILYVDDEPGLLEIGKMFLEQSGQFSVETITSAAEALEILRTGHYDAIISDYQMPVIDGIEFLKRVRASGNTVPFIIFTGRGREEIVIQALNEGADFYLQKGGEPLSQFAELGHKVQKAILQRRAEASIRDHERRTFPVSIYSSPILRDGRVAGLRGIIVDITERKRAEESLRESEGRFSAFMDHLPVTAFIKDEQFTNLYVNRHMEELFGARDWVGKTVRELFPPDAAEKMIADDRLALGKGYRKTIENLVEINGDRKIFETHKFRIDRENKPPLLGGFAIDITERQRVEEALRESEQKYRTVFETTGTATVLIENDETISLANSEFERLSGYRKDEIETRKKWTEFVVQEDLDRMLMQHKLRRQNHEKALTHYEFRFRTRSGEVRDIYLTIDVIPGTGKSVASLLDITERKQVENSLIIANQEYTGLLDQIQDVYYRSDAEGRLTKASRSLAVLLGYNDIAECLGRIISDDFYAKPADRKRFIGEVNRNGKVTDYEVELKKKDGTTVLVATSSHLYFDTAGKILGIEGTFRDITERKRAEQVIREANRKINLLTSITRHDVGNQVIVLRGFTKIALMKKPDPEIAGLLEKIEGAVSTIARQIEFTKEYQELGMHAPGWQRIRDIVAQQQTMEGIYLTCTCDAEVFADPMLERVFFNIIDNAVRHGKSVTAIRVSCQPDPDGLVIVIGDDGVGVPPALKEKIFEKGYGENTGFGLFLAREILAITGIIILETGTHGKGARFEIIVPKGMYRFVS